MVIDNKLETEITLVDEIARVIGLKLCRVNSYPNYIKAYQDLFTLICENYAAMTDLKRKGLIFHTFTGLFSPDYKVTYTESMITLAELHILNYPEGVTQHEDGMNLITFLGYEVEMLGFFRGTATRYKVVDDKRSKLSTIKFGEQADKCEFDDPDMPDGIAY